MDSSILKTTKRFFMYVINVLLLISLLAACSNNPDDNSNRNPGSISGISFDPSEFVYRAQTVPFPALPHGLTEIDNVLLADNMVYFTASGGSDEHASFHIHRIFSMDVDGTDFMELPNYVPGLLLTEAESGVIYIYALHVDVEGYLWVVEQRFFQRHNQDIDMIESVSENVLRKLDKTGAEISAIDLDSLEAIGELYYVNALITDYAGNIYIASESNVIVLDEQGVFLFNLNNQDYISNFIQLSDGTVAFTMWQQSINVNLYRIDVNRRSLGEVIRLPSDVFWGQNVFSGIGEYLYLYNDSSHLNGVMMETGEHMELLAWADSTMSSVDMTGVMFIPDGRIAATRQALSGITGTRPVPELVLLTAIPINELPDKEILTLGTFDFDSSIRFAVEQFNRSSDTHRIDVIDYSVFNTDPDGSAGLLRLSTEIITGNAPDILDLSSMPVHSYASKGLLVDLYPFIDADPELDRSSIIESLLRASEIDGSLYYIIPSFRISTMGGHPSVLGSYPGWNLDEFIDVIEANPDADMPMGSRSDRISFFSTALRNNVDDFVDWASGTANFESDDFIRLLELANKYPREVDHGNIVSLLEMFSSGRQLVEMVRLSGVKDYIMYSAFFDGDVVFKGFPTKHRDGNAFRPSTSIAITTNCSDIDAAWEFLRLFLLEDYQRDVASIIFFPVNMVVIEEHNQIAMNPPEGMMSSATDGSGIEIKLDSKMSQEGVDAIMDLINNTTRIWVGEDAVERIVIETATDFFNGSITSQDAARIIQNRVSTYLAEQG